MTDIGAAEPAHSPGGIGAATLRCEACNALTTHRVLRIDRRSRGGHVAGVARCRVCRYTHPFESRPDDVTDVSVVLSDGPKSEHRRVALPRFAPLRVGGEVPRPGEPWRIHRLEGRTGQSVAASTAGETETVWASRDRGATLAISIVVGDRTRSEKLQVPHGTAITVGEELATATARLEIVALRARGRTWRRPGDSFRADEVDRVYVRRTASPPAGRSDWRRGRGSPRSRARPVSVAPRSRSSPGTSTTRMVPRARTADGGAAVHSVAPS